MTVNIPDARLSGIQAMPFDTSSISDAEAAQYVEQMCQELASLADRTGLGFLAYLLEVAREEASLHCRSDAAIRGEIPPS